MPITESEVKDLVSRVLAQCGGLSAPGASGTGGAFRWRPLPATSL